MGTKRDIYNYYGVKIGELELPNSTTEDEWLEKLAEYAKPPKTFDQIYQDNLRVSVQERRYFCENLIERLKQKNIIEGINAAQALWFHSRFRALPVTYGALTVTIDLMNLVISGDVEVACIAMQLTAPDDMSQPYHWLSSDRKAWIVNELKTFLGWT